MLFESFRRDRTAGEGFSPSHDHGPKTIFWRKGQIATLKRFLFGKSNGDDMIEHRYWLNEAQYTQGIRDGIRLAIVGYSHWDEEPDTADKTVETIAALCAERRSATFFTRIRNFLGAESHSDFWPRVLFFNFIPSYVGDGAKRFANASKAQYAAAEPRFLRILDEHKPDVVLVFSKKLDERLPDGFLQAPDLLAGGFPYGFYERDGYRTLVAMLRHPQGATDSVMISAIDDAFAKCR